MSRHDIDLPILPCTTSENLPGYPGIGYASEALMDELSRQLHGATSRRLSRSNHNQRPNNAMRIIKPQSANNSPRASMIQARRRTLVNDAQFQLPRPQHHGQCNIYKASVGHEMASPATSEFGSRSSRPASWHPSSQRALQIQHQQSWQQQQHHQQQQQQLQVMQYPFPSHTEPDFLAALRQLPPTPAVYSGYTSPASVFSPLSLPYDGDQQQYFSSPQWAIPARQIAQPLPLPVLAREEIEPNLSSFAQHGGTPPDSSLAWTSFVTNGFDRCTAPPTPEDFVPNPQAENKLQAEECIPYQPLENDESDGEILYGMGLYDVPDKVLLNPQLAFHRSTISSLLGSPYKEVEPTGRGLKLEDAWEPPETEDEEEDDEEDEVADNRP